MKYVYIVFPMKWDFERGGCNLKENIGSRLIFRKIGVNYFQKCGCVTSLVLHSSKILEISLEPFFDENHNVRKNGLMNTQTNMGVY